MVQPPESAVSPCCRLGLLHLPLGANALEHYRCAECGTLWVWRGNRFVPCVNPEQHIADSRRQPAPRVAHGKVS